LGGVWSAMSPFLAMLLGGFGLALMPSSTETVLLGVLEHPQCKEEQATAVRALFAKKASDWTALNTEETSRSVSLAGVRWTVAFDGKSLGSITTTDPGFETQYAWTYPRDRLLAIAPAQTVPTIKNKERLFAGWCDAPINRPLAVVFPANFRDPEAWKRFKPAPTLLAELFPHFNAAAGPANTCSPDGRDPPAAWAYSASDLVFSGSYGDKAGKKLVGLNLNPRRNNCDGPPDSVWATHWFVVGKTVQYLGRSLSLVDAGDYDGDGQSEVLFWYSAYNEDGYTLFYDGFRKHVDYHWIYH
jgi:hypothetical protein